MTRDEIQAQHDKNHPGKVCGFCPSEVEHRANLNRSPLRRLFRRLGLI